MGSRFLSSAIIKLFDGIGSIAALIFIPIFAFACALFLPVSVFAARGGPFPSTSLMSS